MDFKLANWPCPSNIKALCTTRIGGYSLSPYGSNNLALHVEDDATLVLKNRQHTIKTLNIPFEPNWLEQTHSTHCVKVEQDSNRLADAAISQSRKHPLVILTADCLPILLCDNQGTEIAAIHAGWKGLFNGIIENTLAKMVSNAGSLLAWIGPAISQHNYVVGEEVYQAFTNKYPRTMQAFKLVTRDPTAPGIEINFEHNKWLADLANIAEIILQAQGVKAIYQSGLCTYTLQESFYSYRRESITGRIGSFIWFN